MGHHCKASGNMTKGENNMLTTKVIQLIILNSEKGMRTTRFEVQTVVEKNLGKIEVSQKRRLLQGFHPHPSHVHHCILTHFHASFDHDNYLFPQIIHFIHLCIILKSCTYMSFA